MWITTINASIVNKNVYSAVRVTQAFIDLLKKSPEPRIVNVSSSQGSITLHSDPTYKYYDYKGAVYLSSKAALNMYTVVLAYELKGTALKVNAVCPGFTKAYFVIRFPASSKVPVPLCPLKSVLVYPGQTAFTLKEVSFNS